MISIRKTGAALAALLLAGCAGCAIDKEARGVTTGTLKPAAAAGDKPAPPSKEETLRRFCAQRHVDYHTGKEPKSADQKAADDRLCEAVGRQS